MNNRFQPIQVGEDNDFVYTARDFKQVISADAGEFMYATIHVENTSIREVDGKVNWIPIPAPDMQVFGVAA